MFCFFGSFGWIKRAIPRWLFIWRMWMRWWFPSNWFEAQRNKHINFVAKKTKVTWEWLVPSSVLEKRAHYDMLLWYPLDFKWFFIECWCVLICDIFIKFIQVFFALSISSFWYLCRVQYWWIVMGLHLW